ncbi:hypothetical protein [Leptospira jelokensis]|uniref:hypothetical protein n=1 Tax=Leptospira jelokensis TaxID=2484931 RepID=UPI003144D81A
MNQIQGLFLPAFVFYFLYLLQTKEKWILIFPILIAYILLSEGAIYTITQVSFLLVGLSIWEIYNATEKKRICFRFVWLSFFILLVLSFKWIPMFLFVHQVGRYFVPDQFPLQFSDLFSIFFGSSQHPLLSQSLSKMQYRYWEYGNYLGQLPLYLFPILVFTKRKLWFVLVLLVFTIWIMLGKGHDFSPVTFLEQIPIYALERVYPRWSLSVVFLYVWCLAEVIQTFSEKFKVNYRVYFSCMVFILLTHHTFDVRKMNTKFLHEIFVLTPPAIEFQNKETYPITVNAVPDYGSDSKMFPAIRGNLSINDIYENLTFYFSNQSMDSNEYHGEFYLYPSFQRVKPIEWKPDQYTFGLLPKDQVLVINQKFHPGFVTNLTDVTPCSWNGYLAVQIDKGIRSIVLEYSMAKATRANAKMERKCNVTK